MACSTCNKSIFEQIKAVSTGVTNYVFTDDNVEPIALQRLEICKTCPNGKVVAKVGNKIVLKCSICKCYCELKARVLTEVCPISKW